MNQGVPMYYPYLRGKQFELILLREQAEFLRKNGIHPIIEPVKKDFAALKRAFKVINDKKLRCTLILNPQVGDLDFESVCSLIDDEYSRNENICLGYILHAESKIRDLVNLLKKYPDRNVTLIHNGFTNGKDLLSAIEGFKNIKYHVFIEGTIGKLYQKHLKKDGINRVLIRNGFKSQKKNAHFPPCEHFSDLHITYNTEEGMEGFGDYLIVGNEYSETGGPAYAVAIHLTFIDPDEYDDMFIYHFVSDKTDSPTDPGGKFLEALEKLVATTKREKSFIFHSEAVKEYIELHKMGHYPGLGYVKKLSMQHHIELIAGFMIDELLS